MDLIEAVPILSVSDLGRSIAYYRDQLGFALEFTATGFPYAGVRRDGMVLHLDAGAHEFAARPTNCRFHVRGVDDLYAELLPRGVVKADEHLEAQPHGMRQFSILDPDGNRVTFAEPIE